MHRPVFVPVAPVPRDPPFRSTSIPPMNRTAIQPPAAINPGAHISVGAEDSPTAALARVLGKRPRFAPLHAPMSLEHSNGIPKSDLEPSPAEITRNRLVPSLSNMQTNELCSATDCPSAHQTSRTALTSTQLSEQHPSKTARTSTPAPARPTCSAASARSAHSNSRFPPPQFSVTRHDQQQERDRDC